MIRRAFTLKLKPGALEEYVRRHEEIWPELVAELEKEGIAQITSFEADGTIFLFSEPKGGWREATARPTKTKVDWAVEVARLLETRYADCEQVTLVCDNLNTHTKGAFYEAFEPERARALVRRLRFRHTPKHGSWLNVAESELSALTRQCIAGRRIGTLAELQEEIAAWSADVNLAQRGVDWQMTIDHARCKLKSIYPKIRR